MLLLRSLSWGNSGHSAIFFGKTSSAGESSEGREVIVIEDEKEIGEVIEEREAPVLEGCSIESLPLQKVRDTEGGNEAGPSSGL